MQSLGVDIRWVPHELMLADGLTKRKGRADALHHLMKTGRLRLGSETEEMEYRAMNGKPAR